MTTAYTKNFALAMPDFRVGPWHDLINGDFAKIDGLIYGAMSQTDISAWQNNTEYTIGITVVDGADASTWMCSVNHTSALAPITFSEDRLANPTYWTQLINGFSPRGEWTNDTQYFPYDLTYQTSLGIFALCKVRHVSNPSGTIEDDSAYWSFLVDFSDIGLASAIAVTYSNAQSPTLTATNVQSAIDQLENQTTALNNVNVTQGTNISNLQAKDVTHETRMTNIESKNASQDSAITNALNIANSKQPNLGFTPVNRAGDDMSGPLYITRAGNVHLTLRGPSNKSAWFYMDDNFAYLLSGDMDNFGGHRPFLFNLNDGNVTIAGQGEYTTINGPCNINGTAWFNSTLGVGGQATFYNNINVSGAGSFGGAVAISGLITSHYGYKCRNGTNGGSTGNVFNWWWTGSTLQAWVDGDPVGNVCDPRLKHDVKPLDIRAVDLIKEIDLVTFRYKDIGIYRDDGERRLGFMADNLIQVFPEAVIGDPTEETNDGKIKPATVDLMPIVVLLMQANKELTRRVEALETLCESHKGGREAP